ncbi:MAG: hypothetical protein ACWA44_01015 [Thiotrichales bacterium]
METTTQDSELKVTEGKNSSWKELLIYSGILAAVIGAVPQFMQLYQSREMGVSLAQVPMAQAQARVWERSGTCLLKTEELSLPPNLKVAVGACEETGDIRVRIANKKGIEMVRWIESIDGPPKAAMLDYFITASTADPLHATQLAAQDDGVICSQQQGEGRYRQRVRENGRCFDLLINIFTGQVISRTPSTCDPNCSG